MPLQQKSKNQKNKKQKQQQQNTRKKPKNNSRMVKARPKVSKQRILPGHTHPGITPPLIGTQNVARYSDSFHTSFETSDGNYAMVFVLHPSACREVLTYDGNALTVSGLTLDPMVHATTAKALYRKGRLESANITVRNVSANVDIAGLVRLVYIPDVRIMVSKDAADAITLSLVDFPTSLNQTLRMPDVLNINSGDAKFHTVQARKVSAASDAFFDLESNFSNFADADSGNVTTAYADFAPGAFLLLINGAIGVDENKFDVMVHAHYTCLVDPDSYGVVAHTTVAANPNHPRRNEKVPAVVKHSGTPTAVSAPSKPGFMSTLFSKIVDVGGQAALAALASGE